MAEKQPAENNFMLLGNVAASATTTFTLPFVPQMIALSNLTTITSMRVTPLGDAPCLDLDAVALACLRNTRQQGAVTAYSEFIIGNGVVKNKTCLVEITNGATVAVAYHTTMSNQSPISLYFQSYKQQVLLGTGTEFKKFAVLALPNSSASDYYIINFSDGVSQRFEQAELRMLLAKFQTVTNDLNDFKIDNIDGWLDSVTVYPANTQLVYVQRWAPIGGMEGAM